MNTFSKLKREIKIALKEPNLYYKMLTTVAELFGFPYTLIPALVAFLRLLPPKQPTWREVGSSLGSCIKPLSWGLLFLAFHYVSSWLLKKMVAKWAAVDHLTQRWFLRNSPTMRTAADRLTRQLVSMAPRETKTAHSWSFWVGRPSAVWGSHLCRVYTVSTVEGFMRMYNTIHYPSKLTPDYDYYVFKEGINLTQADPVWAEGGKWTLSFAGGESDGSWQQTLLALFREEFDLGDEIYGAVVNVRREDENISLWTKNTAEGRAQVISIGEQWKGFMDIKETISFTVHVGIADARYEV